MRIAKKFVKYNFNVTIDSKYIYINNKQFSQLTFWHVVDLYDYF